MGRERRVKERRDRGMVCKSGVVVMAVWWSHRSRVLAISPNVNVMCGHLRLEKNPPYTVHTWREFKYQRDLFRVTAFQ